ncbi:hypothetical protein [Bordetella genomosp. 13]|nr:hypothetical protein [Bordetella genomosp. 13]
MTIFTKTVTNRTDFADLSENALGFLMLGMEPPVLAARHMITVQGKGS